MRFFMPFNKAMEMLYPHLLPPPPRANSYMGLFTRKPGSEVIEFFSTKHEISTSHKTKMLKMTILLFSVYILLKCYNANK